LYLFSIIQRRIHSPRFARPHELHEHRANCAISPLIFWMYCSMLSRSKMRSMIGFCCFIRSPAQAEQQLHYSYDRINE